MRYLFLLACATPSQTALTLSPSEGVRFGKVDVGQYADQTVRIANTGTEPVVVAAPMQGLPDGVRVASIACGAVLPIAQTCSLVLRFEPTQPGAVDGALNLTGGTLPVSGEGRDPEGNDGPGGAPIELSLGQHTFSRTLVWEGFTFDATDTMQFDVTDDDASVMIFATASTGQTGMVVTRIDNPRGERVADGTDVSQHANRSNPDNVAAAVLIPQVPDVEARFVPGTWKFEVWAFEDPHPVDVLVVKTKRAKNANRSVNVEFYFTGANGLTNATAPSHAVFQAALTELKRIWGDEAGIVVNTPRTFDVDAAFADTSEDTLGDLWINARPGNDAIRYFMVSRIAAGVSAEILGLAGGIPGPYLAPNRRSGIAVVIDDSTVGRDLGAVFAHEGSHYLGLFHSVEANCVDGPGCTNDNFDDTPALADTHTKAEFDAAATNLMFFSAEPGSRQLSPKQRETLRRSALIRRE